jgi:hypothetical protein
LIEPAKDDSWTPVDDPRTTPGNFQGDSSPLTPPRKEQEMKTPVLIAIAFALALTALAAPAYAGQPQLTPVQRIILQDQARKNDPRLFSPNTAAQASTPSPIERIIAQENARRRLTGLSGPIQIVEAGSFRWGDAGIGAAAALGLVALAAGALLILRQGRPQSA